MDGICVVASDNHLAPLVSYSALGRFKSHVHALMCCAFLPMSFEGKEPYLRQRLVTQPLSDNLPAEVFWGLPEP